MSTTPRRERPDRPKATGLHWRSHKSHFVWAFAGKMPDTSPLSVLCEPAQSKCTWTFHTSHFVWKFTGEAGRIARDQRFAGACAVEMDMDSSQEPFCVEIYRGNPGCIARDQRFVRACTIEMDMDCVEISRENAGRVCRDTRFVRAWAIDMHMDILQEPFCVEIYKELAGHG